MRLTQFFCIWSVGILFVTVPGNSQVLNDWSLNLIKKNKLSPQHFSMFLATQSSDAILSLRAAEPMLPASITKLMTASAAIQALPPGTKFKTRLMSSAQVENQVLAGDLYLVGGGDPSFVSENMWFLVNQFKRTGITRIEGSIVVDDTLFDQVRYDVTRESTRVDRAYDAPVGAMSFNWNSLNVYVRPGASGKSARVILDPESEYYILDNKVKTTSGKALSIDVDRKWDEQKKKEIFTVTGVIGSLISEHVVFANIQQPDLWSGYNLKSFLEQRGITIKGGVKTGKVSSNGQLLAEAESKPMELILADMNKFSNNYVSEMLTKNISLQSSKPGQMEGGLEMIRRHLAKILGPANQVKMINPSGLTRENRITAEQLWKVLDYQDHEFTSMAEFIASLPIAGVDGTLKKRFKEQNLERKVRAKTGLLNGVISLAGYVENEKGLIAPFVFMYNGPGDASVVRSTMDAVLEKYYSHK